ncbi:MAG: hypothetical protein Q8J78_06455 [Moraxellaceae bacterium]|nr:hypothetical protein [Moraxellaceae bacterium]
MTVHYSVPASVVALADMLRPVEQTLHASLWQAVRTPTRPPLSGRDVRQHFFGIRRFAGNVVDWLNNDLAPLANGDGADLRQLEKAVSKITRLVSTQLARYQTLLLADDASGEGLNTLLDSAYRHNLQELQRWMHDIITLVDRPQAYVSPASPSTVSLMLEFTANPAMEALHAHLMPMGWRGKMAPIGTAPSLLWQLGCLLLGIGIINALFGSESDA